MINTITKDDDKRIWLSRRNLAANRNRYYDVMRKLGKVEKSRQSQLSLWNYCTKYLCCSSSKKTPTTWQNDKFDDMKFINDYFYEKLKKNRVYRFELRTVRNHANQTRFGISHMNSGIHFHCILWNICITCVPVVTQGKCVCMVFYQFVPHFMSIDSVSQSRVPFSDNFKLFYGLYNFREYTIWFFHKRESVALLMTLTIWAIVIT